MQLLLGFEKTYLLGVLGTVWVSSAECTVKISHGEKSFSTNFLEANTEIQKRKLCVPASVTFTGIRGAAVVTFNVSVSLKLITADQTAPSCNLLGAKRTLNGPTPIKTNADTQTFMHSDWRVFSGPEEDE